MPNTSYAQRISNRGVAIQDSGSLEGSNKRILNFSTDLAVDCTTPTAGCTVSSTAGGGGTPQLIRLPHATNTGYTYSNSTTAEKAKGDNSAQ